MTTTTWRRVEALGASFDVPADFESLDPPAAAIVAAALEPDVGLFRANVTLSATPQEDLSFADWQNLTDDELPRLLDDYALIDLEHLDVGGRTGGRRLAHYLAPDGTCVVMEQWCAVSGGYGWTLTWTVDVLRYDQLADVARDSAASLQLPEAVA